MAARAPLGFAETAPLAPEIIVPHATYLLTDLARPLHRCWWAEALRRADRLGHP